MIETVIYNYLKATLSVPVFTERPDLSKHANFVLFEKTGSEDQTSCHHPPLHFKVGANRSIRL